MCESLYEVEGLSVVALTPDDVSMVTFRPTKFRYGYDEAEVDAFLERTAAAMRVGQPIGGLLVEASFTLTRFRAGYEPADVDQLISELRGWAPSPTMSYAQGVATASAQSSARRFPVPLAPASDQREAEPRLPRLPRLTAHDVRDASFRATALRPGYAQLEVDAFLDEIAADLQAGLDVRKRVRAAAFNVVRWHDGYDQRDVDAFLDRLVE